MAMRLARAYTGKRKVMKLQDHFHGWHDYAMAGSDRPSPGIPEASFESMVIVPSGDLDAVEDALNRDPDIAAVILEPTGAHYGQLPFDVPFFLKGLRQLTAQHSVVLIFDEVVTGFRHPRAACRKGMEWRRTSPPWPKSWPAVCPAAAWAAEPKSST